MNNKPFPLMLLGLMTTVWASAQQQPHADLHVHSLLKPWYAGHESAWPFFEHDCAPEAFRIVLAQADGVPKFSQSNFESLLKGDVRLAYLSLSPIEQEMRNPRFFTELEKRRNTMACMAGVSGDWNFFLDEEVDYFQELKGQLLQLRRGEGQPHVTTAGDTLRYHIVSTASDLDTILTDPHRLNLVLSIEGAHALGRGPVTPEMISNEWYQAQVLEHLRWLKGESADPLTGENWEHPIALMTLNHFMWNGLGGHAKTFGPVQSLVLDQREGLGTGLTPFGAEVVNTMLDTAAGRRILVDVKHMSVQCRKDYYALLQARRTAGDTIPVIATHVGVAGCSWACDKKSKGEWMSDWEISLFDEDLKEIQLSHGILGIMLDKYRIAGPLGNKWVRDCPAGSANQREAYVQLLAFNMLEVVDALQCREAWDLISIGSDYDGMINAMEPYASAEDFPDLRNDLLAYFAQPTDLWDEWPSHRVREAMYGLSAGEIVDKVMGGNLVRFTQQTFQKHLHLPASEKLQQDKP